MDEDETLPQPVRRLVKRLRDQRGTIVGSSTTSTPALDREPTLEKRKDYAEGRQFRGGKYWRGRKPKDSNFAEILKLYKQNNQITRCLRTIVSGILGKDPEWDLNRPTGKRDRKGNLKIATAKTDGTLRGYESSVGEWHGDAGVQNLLELAKFVEQWAGSVCLRLYVPDEFTEDAPMEQNSLPNIEAGLELLFPQVVEPGEGGAIRDDHHRIIGYYYLFKEDDADRIELHAPERIYILDNQYNLLTDENGNERSGPNPLYDPARKRRPRFMMFEMKRKEGPALTADVIDAQDALNVSGTYGRRNEDIAGFRSLVTINAKTPKDPEGKDTTWKLSADVTLDLKGIDLDTTDTDYGTGLPNATARVATPSYGVIEPVDPAHFMKSKADYVADIYDHFDLGHLIAPYLAVSGTSKKESRDPYEKRLITESVTPAQALSWTVETALGVAAWLCGDDVSGISCKPRLYLDVSQGSIDLWSALVSGYPDTVSLETLVQVNPAVTDVQTEMERLKTQRAERNAASPPKPEPS